MKDISVVIPTYNNESKLKKVLGLLGQQKFLRVKKPNFEVIVVDDGSPSGVQREARALIRKISMPGRCFSQAHQGPAAARNLGIKKAEGKIILFVDDDKLPSPNLIEEHWLAHKKYPALNVAVLGFTTWAKNLEMTPFLRWMEHGGHQFNYDEIKGQKWVGYRHFFTGNLSLKRDFLLENGLFCEEFGAAYEDLELGYRLGQKGLRVFYNPRAKTFHDHPTSIEHTCQRMERLGRWSKLYNQKVPTSKRLPPWSPRLIFLTLGNPPIYFFLRRLALWSERKVALPLIFNALLLVHYVKGRIKAS